MQSIRPVLRKFDLLWLDNPSGPRPPSKGSSITLRHTPLGRTPLHEGSARRRDLKLTTQNTHTKQDIHPPGGIPTHNLRKRTAVDQRLSQRGH
jgi:hypothetical protein